MFLSARCVCAYMYNAIASKRLRINKWAGGYQLWRESAFPPYTVALCLHGRVWSQVTVIQLCTGYTYMAVFDHTRSTSTPLQIRPWTRRTSILSLADGRADAKCWQFGRFFVPNNGRMPRLCARQKEVCRFWLEIFFNFNFHSLFYHLIEFGDSFCRSSFEKYLCLYPACEFLVQALNTQRIGNGWPWSNNIKFP